LSEIIRSSNALIFSNISGRAALTASQSAIQAVGVVNQRLADILVKQGFRLTTVRIGKEMVEAYEKVFEVY
jgi:hypothetical protein